MSSQHIVFPVDNHRIHKSKLTQRRAKLQDLFLVVRAGVIGIGYSLVDVNKLKFCGCGHAPFLRFKTFCKPFLASSTFPLTARSRLSPRSVLLALREVATGNPHPFIVRYCCLVIFWRLAFRSRQNWVSAFMLPHFLLLRSCSIKSSCGVPSNLVVQFCFTISKISYQSKFACF